MRKQGRDALKAVGLLTIMEKFSTYFGLQLSHVIFSATEQLSITLQGKTTLRQALSITISFFSKAER